MRPTASSASRLSGGGQVEHVLRLVGAQPVGHQRRHAEGYQRVVRPRRRHRLGQGPAEEEALLAGRRGGRRVRVRDGVAERVDELPRPPARVLVREEVGGRHGLGEGAVGAALGYLRRRVQAELVQLVLGRQAPAQHLLADGGVLGEAELLVAVERVALLRERQVPQQGVGVAGEVLQLVPDRPQLALARAGRELGIVGGALQSVADGPRWVGRRHRQGDE
jgi:hypothetical protein